MKTIISIAQQRGSSATTKAGAWRFLFAKIRSSKSVFESRRRSAQCNWDAWRNERMCRRADGRARVLGYPLINPEWLEYCRAYEDNRRWDELATTELSRDNFGALYAHRDTCGKRIHGQRPTADVLAYYAAMRLIEDAGVSGYNGISFDRKGRAEGSAMHVELYDMALDGSACIVCKRETEGTRYGVRTTAKSYFLLRCGESSVAVEPINLQVAKLAKIGANYGAVVAAALGDDSEIRRARAEKRDREEASFIAYKVVAMVGDELRSVYNGRIGYQIGWPTSDRVRRMDDNICQGGGIFVHRTPEAALNQGFPDSSANLNAPRVLLRGIGWGKRNENGKVAVENFTPLAVEDLYA